MCASGARSPLAPTEPWHGTTGVTPRLSIATISVERLRLDAGVTGRERVRAQHARGAHQRNRERLTRPRRMAAHQVELQLDRIGRIDRDVGQPPEAGGHAVDRLAARELRIDEVAGANDAGPRSGSDLDRRAHRGRLERFQRQAVAVELDRHRFAQFGCGIGAKGGPF